MHANSEEKPRKEACAKDLELGLVFRSNGYEVKPLPSICFDPRRGGSGATPARSKPYGVGKLSNTLTLKHSSFFWQTFCYVKS